MRWTGVMLMALVSLLAASPVARTQDHADYTVEDLLEPCVEGDADARWGEPFELICEQYIRGFTDAYFAFRDTHPIQKICFPEGPNRLDLIRWAFVKWARQNTQHSNWPAARGLATAVNQEMCD